MQRGNEMTGKGMWREMWRPCGANNHLLRPKSALSSVTIRPPMPCIESMAVTPQAVLLLLATLSVGACWTNRSSAGGFVLEMSRVQRGLMITTCDVTLTTDHNAFAGSFNNSFNSKTGSTKDPVS